jgi:arylsulfatase A-like enzyme
MIFSATRLRRSLLLACLVTTSQLGGPTRAQSIGQPSHPNILLIVLDDVGVDQLATFNPFAPTGPLTPTIAALADAGVKFTSFYTMPQCSPSRASIFTGRYPFRTGVNAAILEQDLPVAQVSPFEMTTPRVLSTAGYASAMFGKYHLGGPENNPDGNGAPVALGWDYFDGNLRGGPPAIDVSLGGQYTLDAARYSCGFPTGTERGATWFLGADGRVRCDDNHGAGYTGQEGVALGGIPALDAEGRLAPTCLDAAREPDFTQPNGYYVWPQAIADSTHVETARARQYMTTAQTDAAIDWITQRSQGADRGRPWMATVSYNTLHAPYQHPPVDLYPPGFVWPSGVPENCTDVAAQRLISDLMLAAMDHEIGRLLVGIGLAERGAGGQIVYRPDATDTMVVVAGDNGTFIPSVIAPYDPIRSKGTPYQTGVTAPLIVSGPLVAAPGRSVAHLVNVVDLFRLFGEIAGLDVRAVVPRSHALDADAVLPYLTNPNQPAIRRYNFTQLGTGVTPPSVEPGPCVVNVGPLTLATDVLYTSQSLCETGSGGTWFGPTPEQPDPPYPTSCAIRAAGLYRNLVILPIEVWAIRNSRYKLVRVERVACETDLGEFELYDLSPRPPANPLGLDYAATDLLTNGRPVGLTPDQVANFETLAAELEELLASEAACHGDGNLDKRVDSMDLLGVRSHLGQPSVFDFNLDGVTDGDDLPCVWSNFGHECRLSGPGNACR